MQKKQVIILTAIVVITIFATSSATLAATVGTKNHPALAFHSRANFKGMKPGVGGTVAAINGTSLTITGKDGTTYIVDVSNVKISKGFGASAQVLTLSDIKVGDNIAVVGTVNGTNVTATTIIDGIGLMRGNGVSDQYVAHLVGTITTVSPYLFTVDVKNFARRGSNVSTTVSYTVDTNSATTVTKDGKAASLGDLTVGQNVIVTGTIDTNTHTAMATKVNIASLKIKPIKANHPALRIGKKAVKK